MSTTAKRDKYEKTGKEEENVQIYWFWFVWDGAGMSQVYFNDLLSLTATFNHKIIHWTSSF